MTTSRQHPPVAPDPRPHLGEPLALDLLNTRWMSADGPRDLLTDVAGLRTWLSENDLAAEPDEPTLHALVTARDAIATTVRALLEQRPPDTAALNAVLDQGRIRRTLTESGPVGEPDVPAAEWLPGWLAADNLLELIATAPGRIRQCAHPACVLYFFDTSKNGTRRWHSMTTCGNRAKATRHYARKTEQAD
ncbi:CGNR zinc finger domain-containing protein [Nocardia jejuensis]|uniref:CGNR zinc finger domain-containing protein n=1 Tax=Nocardia jejuensis TaxID=328049 RepID=UPI00083489AD|nr:CGNR zinc finger domain-containing protein [Nocardia jejuensis]